LFLRWMVRTYMPIYIAYTGCCVKQNIAKRVPMQLAQKTGSV